MGLKDLKPAKEMAGDKAMAAPKATKKARKF